MGKRIRPFFPLNHFFYHRFIPALPRLSLTTARKKYASGNRSFLAKKIKEHVSSKTENLGLSCGAITTGELRATYPSTVPVGGCFQDWKHPPTRRTRASTIVNSGLIKINSVIAPLKIVNLILIISGNKCR